MFASMKKSLVTGGNSRTKNDKASDSRLDESVSAKVNRRKSNTDRSVGSTDSSSSSSTRGGSTGGAPLKKKSAAMYAVELNPNVPVPLSAISYGMVTTVVSHWEQGVKRIPKWDVVVGEKFLRKVFELDSSTITMFGFPGNIKYDDPKLSEDKAFLAKSSNLLKAIDIAVGCLGPDLSPLENQLLELGARHTVMNCRPHHWPVIGKALMFALDECLDSKLSEEDKEAWTVIYNFLSYHMVRGLLKKKPCLAGTAALPEEATRSEFLTTPAPKEMVNASPTSPGSSSKLDCSKPVSTDDINFDIVTRVLVSWEKGIKIHPNWSSKTGFLFMRYIFKHCGAEGKKLMGYSDDIGWDDPSLTKDPVFLKKGMRLISGIDMAISLFGPDLSTLEYTMADLGRKHYHMDCKPEHWPLVGEALFDVFRESMGEDGAYFTAEVEEAWTIIYSFLGYHMIKGLNAEANGE